MRRRPLLAILPQAALVLAGCSSSGENGTPTATETDTPTATPTATPTPTPDYEFETSVSFPLGGVMNDPVQIEVSVTNSGPDAGEFEATLTHDGDDLTSEAVRVGPGEASTVTLQHSFPRAGEFDVAVAGAEATLVIFEHSLGFVHAAMDAVDTLRIERTVHETGVIDLDEGPTEWEQTSTVTVEKNFDEGTLYSKREDDIVYGSEPIERTIEEWATDGVVYEKHTNHTEETVDYVKYSSDRPLTTTALDIHGTDTEPFLSVQETDEEYVFVFEPETAEAATALAARTLQPGGPRPAEAATAARMELRYDRVTGRATTYESDVTLEDAETFPELERSSTDEYVAYGEPVEVSVPDEVRENAG